jgi:hypothetical protein
MNARALLEVIEWLDDGAEITVTVKKQALQAALTMAQGGPAVLSTSQAARLLGYTAERWASWAKAGRLDGAYRDEQGRWRLPNPSCRSLLRELQEQGRHAPRRERASNRARSAPLASASVVSRGRTTPASVPTPQKSFMRGPREKRAPNP